MRTAVLAVFLIGSLTLQAQSEPKPLRIPIQQFKLDNGLRIVFSEDHSAPTYGISITYNVGSHNEHAGRTGFAHLFEHMMFEGSKHVGEKAHFKYLEAAGATDINGTTSFDRTNYFETVPANQLETALWLESDRMGFLLDTLDRAKLTNQRDVVRNEKRQGEGRPYGIVDEEVYHLLFPKEHPYFADVMGSHADIEAARLTDIREFFTQYYAPNNATMAIAGDYDPATIKALIEKYFGPIPQGPPVTVTPVATAAITAERRKVVTDTVQLPKVILAWLSAPAFKPGDADADIAARVLGSGKSSRMYRELVYKQQIAQSVNCYDDSESLASTFECQLIAKPGVTPEKLEAEAEKIIDGFAESGPKPEEVEWARNKVETELISGLQRLGGFGGVADQLNSYNQYTGDPGYLPKDLARYDAVTTASVQQYAKTTLGKDQRVVVWGVPGKKVLDDVPRSPDDTDANVKISPQHTPEFEAAQAWRATAPQPGPERPLVLPKPTVFTLDNGLTVYLVERHELPIVSVQLLTLAGGDANPPDQPGLAGITASLLTEGTAKRSAEEIAGEASLLGTDLRSSSDSDGARLAISLLSKHVGRGMELLADSMEHPAFPSADLERIRANRLTSLLQQQDNPIQLALRAGELNLFGAANPYGYDALGTADSLHAITRDEIAAFHDAHYGPRTSLLELTGDVTLAEARKLAEETLGKWTSNAVPVTLPQPPAAPERKILLIDKPGSPQTALLAFGVGIPRSSPDYAAATVMNTMLGGLFSSRINMNLREDKHWSYGVRSVLPAARGQRPYISISPVQTDKTKESMVELVKEYKDVVGAKPITAEELKDEQDNATLALPGNFETVQQLSGGYGNILQYGLPEDYYNSFTQKALAVTPDGANEIAKKYISPDHLVWVVVGDMSKVESGIRELNVGEVHKIDADGNPAQ